MSNPKITVLLCTVRPDNGYANEPDRHIIGSVISDLCAQTFKDFELVVVDGLFAHREGYIAERYPADEFSKYFSIVHVPPTQRSFWVRNKHVAISAYRNTGIAHARGELIVNLDDCCELPPNYLEYFWSAWSRHKIALSPVWRASGDNRPEGIVQSVLHDGELRPAPGIYGFGSYPRELALTLNGYDEAYDGGQGLEDADWSTRLHQAGLKMGLVEIPGFLIHPQTGHDERAVRQDGNAIVKCCNRAWNTQRVWKHSRKANIGFSLDAVNRLYGGPCPLLGPDNCCMHHGGAVECAYLDKGLHLGAHEKAQPWKGEGFNLKQESEQCLTEK